MSSISGGILSSISGAQHVAYTVQTDNYTVLDTDLFIEMNHLVGGKLITLPLLADTANGRMIIVVNNSNGTTRIRPVFPEAISGGLQWQLNNVYDSVIVVKGSTQWLVASENV